MLVCTSAPAFSVVEAVFTVNREAQQSLAVVQGQLEAAMRQLEDYEEVRERYSRYSATEEERALIDRIEVLKLLDEAVGDASQLDSVTISGTAAQVQISEKLRQPQQAGEREQYVQRRRGRLGGAVRLIEQIHGGFGCPPAR